MSVEAVLFDSGGVLIGPAGGRWNPRFDFESIVRRQAPGLTDDALAGAIDAGDRFLDSAATTPTRDDYHRVMLRALGIAPDADLLAELEAPVDATLAVEPYPEVIDVLDQLRVRGIRMAVVSDNWPNLPAVHVGVGLGGYFEVYAISADLGCTKPDPRMYQHACDGLGLAPGQCLFVDDDPALVEAAIALGYRGCAVQRDGGETPGITSVPDLTGVLTLLDG